MRKPLQSTGAIISTLKIIEDRGILAYKWAEWASPFFLIFSELPFLMLKIMSPPSGICIQYMFPRGRFFGQQIGRKWERSGMEMGRFLSGMYECVSGILIKPWRNFLKVKALRFSLASVLLCGSSPSVLRFLGQNDVNCFANEQIYSEYWLSLHFSTLNCADSGSSLF